MRLIIVSGATATGKTTIAKQVADSLGYALYSKDIIKEALFDSQTKASHGYFWYERHAKDIFFREIEKSISQDTSIIAESNFMKNDKRRLKSLLNKNVLVAEIYCSARGFIRLRRFVSRGEGTIRHKAHRDRRWYLAVFIECLLKYVGIEWPYGPVGISGKMINVDTTDFSKVNFENILEFAKKS